MRGQEILECCSDGVTKRRDGVTRDNSLNVEMSQLNILVYALFEFICHCLLQDNLQSFIASCTEVFSLNNCIMSPVITRLGVKKDPSSLFHSRPITKKQGGYQKRSLEEETPADLPERSPASPCELRTFHLAAPIFTSSKSL